MKTQRPEGKFICRCDCGGAVYGVREFGQLFTVCMKCSPVVKVPASALLGDTREGGAT